MKNTGALLTLLLLASVASTFAVEPLFAKNKTKKSTEAVGFTFHTTSGKAYPISDRKTSYTATLTLNGERVKIQERKQQTINAEEEQQLTENTQEQRRLTKRIRELKWLTHTERLNITDGSLAIGDYYYAAKVYKILSGFGLYNEKNGGIVIVCVTQEEGGQSTYRLILHGKMNSDGIVFEAPQSKLVSQYFLEISGNLE